MKRLCVFLMMLIPALVSGQSIPQKADELLTAYTQQNKFSGNVLIAQGDSVLFQKSYGFADREKKIPNSAETEFRVGSLTKMFTSALIFRLIEAGKLQMNDPLSKYLPDFPTGETILLKHLLSHTSGIKGSTEGPPPATLGESVSRFKSAGLAFLPGERFEYNNFNYILLSYIAEKITGKPFRDLLKNTVLEKAGMTHSGLDYTGRNSAHQARGYLTNPQAEWVPEHSANVAIASGAGALYSTVGDLFKWSEAVSAGKVLSDSFFKKATTVVKGDYGSGWIVNTVNGRREIGHTGSIEGFIASFMKYPEDDITIIMLSNYGDTNGRQLKSDLTALVFNEPYKLPRQKKEVNLGAAVLRKYAGVYQLNENFRITVTLENNKLYAKAPGDMEKVEFIPESETQFYLKGPETEIEFVLEGGKVIYMIVKMGGEQKFTRIS